MTGGVLLTGAGGWLFAVLAVLAGARIEVELAAT